MDPGVARMNVRGGALRALAADPSEDRGGFIDLCALGMSPFPCATSSPFRPEPTSLPLIPLIPLHTDPIGLQTTLTDQQQALLGCGPFYGTLCDDTTLFPGVDAQGIYLPSAGNQNFGRRDFVWIGVGPDGEFVRRVEPFGARPRMHQTFDPERGFQSEMAALSWNALMLLVAQSQFDGTPSEDELDPSDPFRTDGCSFAAPHLCINVVGFIGSAGWRFNELEGDPRGGEPLRWLWESAIAYDIVHARGELAAFRDGRLYVYGPFESPIEGFASGVGLLLVPPPGAVPEVISPMMRVGPGLDRSFGTEDDSLVGFAWGAAWPGFDGVTERRPQARGHALGHPRDAKAGAGSSGAAGRRPGRP
jgi:hypothetical protein